MGPAKGMVGSAALWGGGRVKLGPYPPQEGGAPGPDWMLRGLEGSTVHKPGPTDTHSGPDSATSSLEGVTLPYLPIHTLVLSYTPHILFINTSHYPPTHTHTRHNDPWGLWAGNGALPSCSLPLGRSRTRQCREHVRPEEGATPLLSLAS